MTDEERTGNVPRLKGKQGIKDHPVIWLQPNCPDCWGDEGRVWCEYDEGPCRECRKPWVKYILSPTDTPEDGR